jgi:hypothetical protein
MSGGSTREGRRQNELPPALRGPGDSIHARAQELEATGAEGSFDGPPTDEGEELLAGDEAELRPCDVGDGGELHPVRVPAGCDSEARATK